MIKKTFLLKSILLVCIGVLSVQADVPTTYKGKPYGGSPRLIPGRIDFEDYDMGGLNIAWKTDNKAGVYGTSAANRANDGETTHPGLCISNTPDSPNDHYAVTNAVYPNAANPSSAIYIGAAHATDWVNVTVHVKKTGKYWMSTSAASDPDSIKFHVSINGVNKTGTVALRGTNNYHIWKDYNSFKSIQLDSGIYVMQFMLDEAHMNYDYLTFQTDSGVVDVGGQGLLQNALAFGATAKKIGKDLYQIDFMLPSAGSTTLNLSDIRGHVVQNIFQQKMDGGQYHTFVDAKQLPAGIYYLRLEQGNQVKTIPLTDTY